jgi:flagellar motility protein MotE (MotC chaperone)
MNSLQWKRRPRFVRLLPGVVVIGTAVLALKTTDLVHAAYAQVSGQMAALTNDPVPANKDYAGGEDDQVASASEVDVMNDLSKRRRELDARDTQLTTQANMIAATEARVDAKIAQLKQLQDKINALLGQRDQAQKDQIASLVKTYSTMGKKAGPIFAGLPDEVAVPVAQAMKSDDLATIMGAMPADAAQKLTVKLANRLTLPQTADAAAPAPAPQAAQAAAKPPAASAEKQAPPNG